MSGNAFSLYRADNKYKRTSLIGQNLTYDPRTRPWFTAAQSLGRGGWSPVYVFADASSTANAILGITYFWPVYKIDRITFVETVPRTLVGVLAVDITLDSLTKFMSADVAATPFTTNYVMDRVGNLVASPDGAVVDLKADDKRMKAIHCADRAIASSALQLSQTSLTGINDVSTDAIGVPVVSVYPYVEMQPSFAEIGVPDWIFVSSTPYSQLYGEADISGRKTFWILFSEFTLVSTIAAIIVGRIAIDRSIMSDGNVFELQKEFDSVTSKSELLRHATSIEIIYNSLSRRRVNYFRNEIRCAPEDALHLNADELLPKQHTAWLRYLSLAGRNLNIENFWILRRIYGEKSWSLQLYMMETHWLYRAYIALVSTALCALAFWEPTNWAINYTQISWPRVGVESVLISLIILDTMLQTFLARQLESFKRNHFLVQTFFCVCFSADLIGYASFGFIRWSRLLRPLYLVYRLAALRSAAILVSRAMMNGIYVILLFFYVVILSDITAVALAQFTFTSDGDFSGTNFFNFYSGFVNIFILLTTSDNYGACVDPTVRQCRFIHHSLYITNISNTYFVQCVMLCTIDTRKTQVASSPWYMLFWVSITIIGKYFILSALIAEFSNTYYEYAEEKKHRLRARRWMALAATFIIFDTNDKGKLSRRDFTIFVATYLRTRHPEFDAILRSEQLRSDAEETKLAKSPRLRRRKGKGMGLQDALTVKGIPANFAELINGCFHTVDDSGDGSITIDEFERGLDLSCLCYVIQAKSTLTQDLSKHMWYVLFLVLSAFRLCFTY